MYTPTAEASPELTLVVGSAGPLGPRFHRRVGLKARKYIPDAFFNIFMESWTWNFVGNRRFFLGASGEGLFPKAPAKGFS